MVEVLSPAGDRESFYRAITSGADAIYMGAPKFNARMKASNFTLEDMREVVKFAHLKSVKIYITLNTLVTNAELKEVVSLAGELWKIGVDAFIVQDLGIATVLKSAYPDIVLHGSTQMAIHNWRGALVAKEMGLERVVLSREVTLDDIAQIREKVDIELEHFVQGALCVAFSGNCYMSSIKCSASGNRGECKQLCRLPYTASVKGKEVSGYLLSPRDICNIDYIYDLITLGVVSFKIEGRLRRAGYVAKATEAYRAVVDSFYRAEDIDTTEHKSMLKKIFSRGQFIPGYFEGNDIIETTTNNHIGEPIGEVRDCKKFKDIYKITISLKPHKSINSGDGLKYKVGDNYITMGVGNVENSGNNIIVFVKNHIESGSIVYKAVDNKFESEVVDNSKYRVIKVNITGIVGNRFEVESQCDGHSKVFFGDTVTEAKTRAITEENIISQFSKVDKGIWRVEFGSITIDDIFMPISKLNEIRREMIEYYERVFYTERDTKVIAQLPKLTGGLDCNHDSMAIVSSEAKIAALQGKYDRLIFAPIHYTKGAVKAFINEYKKYYNNKPVLRLPIIAMCDDLDIIDDIIMSYKNDIAIMAENLYGLSYIRDGVEVIAGANMNITNDYTVEYLQSVGVREAVSSIEKWCSSIRGTYKIVDSNLVLMTLAHCPYKTINKSTCDKCTFAGDIALKGAGHNFVIRRYRVSRCYYELVDTVLSRGSASHTIVDLRTV